MYSYNEEIHKLKLEQDEGKKPFSKSNKIKNINMKEKLKKSLSELNKIYRDNDMLNLSRNESYTVRN